MFPSLRPLFTAVALGLAGAMAPAQAQAQSPEEMAARLGEAVVAARGRDWAQAEALAASLPDPVAADIIAWTRLRAGEGSVAAYLDFLRRNGDWPAIDALHRAGEAVIARDARPEDVLAFFDGRPARTGAGTLAHAAALDARGRGEDARALLVSAWGAMPLTAEEETAFLSGRAALLAPHHTRRLDTLLWRGLTEEAERMLPRVSEEWRRLGEARIALRRDVAGVDARIAAVPAALREHPGLAWERFLWRDRRGRTEDARDLMVAQSQSAEALGEPERWAARRRAFARSALRAGDDQLAYELSSRHFTTAEAGFDHADLEWIAGYVALMRLNDPARAVTHFEAFGQAVSGPISLGRAGYWLGRAHEAAGDPEAARAAFVEGAAHQTSFYGQLSAIRAGLPADPALAGREPLPDWRRSAFVDTPLMRAGLLLYLAGERVQALRFFEHVAGIAEPEEVGMLGTLLLELNEPFLALRVAKRGAARGIIWNAAYYPITEIAAMELDVPPEVALAIARQESEFNPVVRSPAGALGLMQLMPRTAEAMAAKLGEPFSEARLTSDIPYNARLGAAYLAERLEEYDGSLLLSFAAYNAGPARVRRWLAEIGDPRTGEIDPVDWIELLPFNETRNYAMRTMEALDIYRARLGGTAGPLRLEEELGRRR